MALCQLYRHFNAEGSLLYVGVSASAAARLAGHKRSGWFQHIARVTVEGFSSRGEAETAERAAIRREKPLFNKAHSCAPRPLPVFESVNDEPVVRETRGECGHPRFELLQRSGIKKPRFHLRCRECGGSWSNGVHWRAFNGERDAETLYHSGVVFKLNHLLGSRVDFDVDLGCATVAYGSDYDYVRLDDGRIAKYDSEGHVGDWEFVRIWTLYLQGHEHSAPVFAWIEDNE